MVRLPGDAVWDSSDGALEFADNAKARIGNDDDLKYIMMALTVSLVITGTGDLHIRIVN